VEGQSQEMMGSVLGGYFLKVVEDYLRR
jgi:hypothetical protein